MNYTKIYEKEQKHLFLHNNMYSVVKTDFFYVIME